MDIETIFSLFYSENQELKKIVGIHSEAVAHLAEKCIVDNNLNADLKFIREAALLHDIGVVKCNAPGILCFGELPYICHGVEGSRMLESLGFHRHALVCERHTGAGLSVSDIQNQHLPLPLREMMPVSIEEKVICYADKFYSKSGNLTKEKTLEKVMAQMKVHGEDVFERFMNLHRLFKHQE